MAKEWMRLGEGRPACRTDVLGVCVCVGGVAWSVKGSLGTTQRAFVEPAVVQKSLFNS